MAKGIVRALAEEVLARRMALQMSQEDFAEEVGVSRNTIGFIERAQRAARITVLKQLADALRMSLSEFCTHVERRLR